MSRAARCRLDGLAKPPGSLGGIEDLAVWWAATRGRLDAPPPTRPALVIFAADHGVVSRGVSAYPPAVTAAMVRAFLAGGAAAAVLCREHGVALSVLDVGVDTDWAGVDLPAEVTAGKAGRGSAALDTADALTPAAAAIARGTGRAAADRLVDSGHDLLLTGDMGIGNTTAAAAVTAALTGLPASAVVGRGAGVDDAGLARKRAVVQRGLDRFAATGASGGWSVAAGLGGADLVAMAAFCLQAARRRTPVLLDGVVSGAAALIAREVDAGCVAWFAAGHRSTEPAHRAALEALGLHPVLDLGLRLGEGTGALLALPLLRSAVLVMRQTATLDAVRALVVPADPG